MTKTRILRLLLLFAVALPLCLPARAQEMKKGQITKISLQKENASVKEYKLKDNSNFAVNEIAESQKPTNGKSDVAKAIEKISRTHSHAKAPSLKAGGQIYDYYNKTIADGNNTNENYPIRGSALNTNRSWGQMIYSSSLMGLQSGDQITGIVFFSSNTITEIGEGQTNKVTLRVGETSTANFNNGQIGTQMSNNQNNLQVVYSGALPTGDKYVFFDFSDNPYTYTDASKNFMVDLSRDDGNYASTINWYYSTQDNYVTAYWYGNQNAARVQRLPTMQIYYRRAHTGTAETRTIAVKDSTFFKNIEYQWTNSEGTHTSNLNEIATDPDQMIAMVREIYTNKTIPGNLKRGFATDGSNSGQTNQDVYYSGVGGIDLTGQYVDVTDSYVYNDIYGWNIPGNVNEVQQSPLLAYYRGGLFENSQYTYAYYATLDQEQYKPNEEGLTLLLVEMKENYADGSNDAISTDQSYTSEYDRLKAYFQNTVKSIRVINQAKRMGEGLESGTLFKIDCDKMNKFFLLAKGQLNLDHNSPDWVTGLAANDYISGTVQNNNIDFCVPPGFMYFYYSTSTYNPNFNSIGGIFSDSNAGELFYHMFEQFSPVANNASAGMDDIYQSLINMDSFGVKHDCIGITQMNHQFLMYGADSKDEDCQDVRDMMFFVPDYRMLEHASRGSSTQQYHNYHPDLQPNIGLYVIRQNEITPTTAADDYYMLNLNWVTNLDDFLPSEDQEFELLQIVVNDSTGLEEYVHVYYMNENGEYTDAEDKVVTTPVPIVLQFGAGAEKNYPSVYVARQSSSQQVTYAIRGRDTGHFLSLQISNRQSYIIPGTDPTELVSLIELSHYSRYNPDLEENCYSNRFKLSNNVGGVLRADITSAQTNQTAFTFTRRTSATAEPVVIATAKVTNKPSGNSGTITIEMQNQAAEAKFPKAKTGDGYAGYHANPNGGTWEHTFTYDNIDGVQYVDFGDLIICDNFVVDVSNNEHPSQYIYEVTFNIATSNQGSHDFDEAHGSAFRVPIYKTASRINNTYTAAEVNGDMDRSIEIEDLTFGERVQYSSKTEILRYDVYRWNSTEETLYIVDEVYANDTEQDLPPNGIAGNQGEGYTVSMNDVNGQYYYDGGTVTVSTSGLKYVDFVDYYPARVAESSGEASAYIYAPVVESFTTGKNSVGVKRTDYNTYGGPQQVTAVGVLDVKVQQPDVNSQSVGYMSTYNWTNDGKTYAYYNVPLTISKKDVPAGYGIYKIRTWREIDAQYLNEEHADVSDEIARRMDSSYPFEDITFDPNVQNPAAAMDAIDELGVTEKTLEGVTTVAKTYTTGTFGAQKVGDGAGEIAELPMKFYVRIYFTRNANLPVAQTSNAPRLKDATAADGKYYIVEKEIPFSITKNNIITAIDQLNARQVAGVKYYNVAGVESDRPFHGVNIVVTRYTDGSMTTTKVVK